MLSKRFCLKDVFATCVFLIVTFAGTATAYAQNSNNLPVRPYNNPQEMIVLSKDMTFSQAIDVLNTYAVKYEHKFILNRTSIKGPIGASLPAMNWHDALKYLGEIDNFQVVQNPKYYELRPVSADSLLGNSVNQASGSGAVKTVNTKTNEVLISATFFEGNKDALTELGIDWSTFKNGVVQIASNSATDVINNNQFSVNISPFEIGHSGIKVQGLFQAFESKDLGQIISQPTIKVIDGQKGKIDVGQTFFINQKDFSGNTVSRSYNVGTILQVTPHVVTQHDTTFIDLAIHGERSSLQPNTASPIVNTQTSDSDILLLSGESTVIAGLYETTSSTVRKGIPILKDLPPWFFGLRYLFGYNSKDYTEQELIILIKATLIPNIHERIAEEKKTGDELIKEQHSEMEQQNAALTGNNGQNGQ